MKGKERIWPLAGSACFVAAAACLFGFVAAPAPVLVVALVILIAGATSRRRLGSWWVPVLVTSAFAILLSSAMLVISFDFGLAECPDGQCDEETSVPEGA